jgi:hypothetical protein
MHRFQRSVDAELVRIGGDSSFQRAFRQIQVSRGEGVLRLHLAKAHLDAAIWSGRRAAWCTTCPRLMSAIGVNPDVTRTCRLVAY